jgi:hypothetical protein
MDVIVCRSALKILTITPAILMTIWNIYYIAHSPLHQRVEIVIKVENDSIVEKIAFC